METQIFISRVLATIYLTFGLGILINPTFYKKELPKLLNNSIFSVVFGGFFAIIFGGYIVYFHHKWNTNLQMLISIIGWISLLKGFALFLFPTMLSWYKKNILTEENITTILLAILLVVGLLFSFFGFYYY